MSLKQLRSLASKHKRKSSKISYAILTKDDVLKSKIGGLPYMEEGFVLPVSKDGVRLRFLAQINFKSVPNISDLYPEKGLLQLYVAEESWGLNYHNSFNSGEYKVVYWDSPDFSKYVAQESDFYSQTWDSPHFRALDIFHNASEDELCGGQDEYYVSDIYKELGDLSDEQHEELYEDDFSNDGSKIGGYAYFTQSDPRAYNQEQYNKQLDLPDNARPEWHVLLQLDSDVDDMMWGDCGVANLFITKEDLLNHRFDRVLYNWDCC